MLDPDIQLPAGPADTDGDVSAVTAPDVKNDPVPETPETDPASETAAGSEPNA